MLLALFESRALVIKIVSANVDLLLKSNCLII